MYGNMMKKLAKVNVLLIVPIFFLIVSIRLRQQSATNIKQKNGLAHTPTAEDKIQDNRNAEKEIGKLNGLIDFVQNIRLEYPTKVKNVNGVETAERKTSAEVKETGAHPLDFSMVQKHLHTLDEIADHFQSEASSNDKLDQLRSYFSLVQDSKWPVDTICEVGFDGGYTALTMLYAAPMANLVGFDNWWNKPIYKKFVINKLRGYFPDRTILISKAVTEFTGNCDIIHISSATDLILSIPNLLKLRNLANPNNLFIMDECNDILWNGLIKDGFLTSNYYKQGTNKPKYCIGSFTEPIRSFQQIWQLIRDKTYVSKAKSELLYDKVQILDKKGLQGDFVECGVWKGGMSMLMALATTRNRTLWLFDTYEGHPGPTDEKDDSRLKKKWLTLKSIKYFAGPNRTKGINANAYVDSNGVIRWSYVPLVTVSQNMKITSKKYYMVKGKVEDTLKGSHLPEKISLLRLDTDFYSSTKVELEVLFSRLVPGGLLIVDDYCDWDGSRIATDEFMKTNRLCGVDIHKGGSCFYAYKCSNRK